MKYIKKFNSLNEADGYIINDIPFICSADNKLAMCNEEGKKLVINNGKINIEDNINIYTFIITDPYSNPDKEFRFELGMNWSRWIESEYNTDYPNAYFDSTYGLVLDPEYDNDGGWEYKYLYIEVNENDIINAETYVGDVTDFI